MKDLKYLFAYLAPIAAFVGIYMAGWWSLGSIYIGFVLVPLLEFFTPNSEENLSPVEEDTKVKSVFFDLLLYLNLPLFYLLLVYFFSRVASGDLATYEVVMMTLNVGLIAGTIGINVAHELGHRANKFEQTLSKMLLMPTMYMHFFIEHNRGHHKNVATPEDPATSRLGESLYAFWIRSVTGGYVSAWNLENKRLQSEGHSFWSFQNEMLRFQIIQLGYLTTVGLFFGPSMIVLAILVGILGFLLLETVNYIEHYGLMRKKLPNGRYEHVRPCHSWNSNHEMGRIFLYELTRHSDHHYKASRKYQILRHMDDSPQLPFGYPTAMMISLVPPLWFKIMDGRVQQQAFA